MKPYPKAKDTPSRKARKGARTSVFLFNKKSKKQLKRAAVLAARIAR